MSLTSIPNARSGCLPLGMADYVQALLLSPLVRTIEQGRARDRPEYRHLSQPARTARVGRPRLGSHRHWRDHPGFLDAGAVRRWLRVHGSQGAPAGAQAADARALPVIASRAGGAQWNRGQLRGHRARAARPLAPRGLARVELLGRASRGCPKRFHQHGAPKLLARRMAKRFALQIVPAPLRIPRFGLSLAWHPRFNDDPAHRWLRAVVSRTSVKP